MKKLFSLDIAKAKFNYNFCRPEEIMLATHQFEEVSEILAESEDEKDELYDTFVTFQKAYTYGLLDYELPRSDIKKLCNLYVNRHVLRSHKKDYFYKKFDEFLWNYIKEHLHKVLSYAINLYIQIRDYSREYVQRFGNLIVECLSVNTQELLRPWREANFIFSPNASQMIADKFFENQKFDEVLRELPFSNEIQLQSPILLNAIRLIFNSSIFIGNTKILMLQDIFKGKRYREILPECITAICQDDIIKNNMIKKELPTEDTYMTQLINFLVEKWGDPRQSNFNENGWRLLDNDLLSYLRFIFAKSDLELFMMILDKCHRDTTWIYREKFWSSYLKYVRRTRVFLTEAGRKEALHFMIENPDKKLYFGEISKDKSMIAFEFDSFCIIEWTHNGRVLILNDLKDYEVEIIFAAQSIKEDDIKKEGRYYSDYNVVEKIAHSSPTTYSWQRQVQRVLESRFNLIPTQSYYL